MKNHPSQLNLSNNQSKDINVKKYNQQCTYCNEIITELNFAQHTKICILSLQSPIWLGGILFKPQKSHQYSKLKCQKCEGLVEKKLAGQHAALCGRQQSLNSKNNASVKKNDRIGNDQMNKLKNKVENLSYPNNQVQNQSSNTQLNPNEKELNSKGIILQGQNYQLDQKQKVNNFFYLDSLQDRDQDNQQSQKADQKQKFDQVTSKTPQNNKIIEIKNNIAKVYKDPKAKLNQNNSTDQQPSSQKMQSNHLTLKENAQAQNDKQKIQPDLNMLNPQNRKSENTFQQMSTGNKNLNVQVYEQDSNQAIKRSQLQASEIQNQFQQQENISNQSQNQASNDFYQPPSYDILKKLIDEKNKSSLDLLSNQVIVQQEENQETNQEDTGESRNKAIIKAAQKVITKMKLEKEKNTIDLTNEQQTSIDNQYLQALQSQNEEQNQLINSQSEDQLQQPSNLQATEMNNQVNQIQTSNQQSTNTSESQQVENEQQNAQNKFKQLPLKRKRQLQQQEKLVESVQFQSIFKKYKKIGFNLRRISNIHQNNTIKKISSAFYIWNKHTL